MPYRAALAPYVFFAADPPDLPIRGKDDTGGPEYIIKAALAGQTERGVTLNGTTINGMTLNAGVTIAAPGVARVFIEGEPGRRVQLARDRSALPVNVSVQVSGNCVELVTPEMCVQITLDPFSIRFFHADGRLMLAQNSTDTDVTDRLITLPFGYSEVNGQRAAFHDSFTVEPDEHFYGFGEKFTDFDKRGQRLEMWHYDAFGAASERAYKNVPFFLSTRGYGLFVDSHRPVRFDMAASNHSVFSVIVPDTTLDYYVIAGPELKTVVSRYTDLVSYPILPPKWSFGLWMSSGFKRDDADAVLARARELRESGIPADVLHLDCYWQKFGRWSDMQWDTEMFPDPAALIQQVHDAGFKVCLWINSYIGVESPLLQEAIDKGYMLKKPDGEAWIGQLWGGYHPPVGIVDLTNPAAVEWYKSLLRPHLEMGADVFKTDFGEGVPADTVAYNGMTGVELHNLYTLIYNDIVADLTAELSSHHTGLVWGRSTYAGGQRHAAQWGGDPNCTFQGMASTLRGGLSMGACGHAFWSHDIAGFHRTPTPELYARWAQFGLFSPLSRAHGMSSRLPWDYGEETTRIFRDYVRLRYRLLPYIYSYAAYAHETGLPMLRAMVLEFPDDPCTYTLDLQYMFGSELLVAPIFNTEGRRTVYFPAGRWVDYWTHEIITGPQSRLIEAPLDVLPLYVKADALIPTTEPVSSTADEPFAFVTFDAYLLDKAVFDLRDTDGSTCVTAALHGGTLTIEVEGAKAKLGLRLLPLPGANSVERVIVNGHTLDKITALELSDTASAGWSRGADGVVVVVTA